MTELNEIHVPVLLERCLELLEPALSHEGAVLIDATLGMGGHTEAALNRFPGLRVIGIDRDEDAIAIASERLGALAERVQFVHAVYDEIDAVCEELGITAVDGVLFDLGVSSLQLDRAERGFAYSQDAPLDMRMDRSGPITAAHILAEYSEAELRSVFYRYGDEKLAPRYARAIVAERERAAIERSGRLVEILSAATPAALRHSGHPAKRVFQALRIEVNQELAALERAIPAALNRLRVGGRIVVLSYQSLEDRLVKRAFAAAASSSAPAGLPQELPEHRAQFRLLVRGAERASQNEQDRNSRATPVRLRAAERLRAAA